jgi:flavin reductase (DIM6/NTAB) family NADH-FMN oxidoreductase RutF
VIIDPDTLDPQSRYKLLIGSVVPRPIAWTSTVSREGARNLAPFSFFTVASRNPPIR